MIVAGIATGVLRALRYCFIASDSSTTRNTRA